MNPFHHPSRVHYLISPELGSTNAESFKLICRSVSYPLVPESSHTVAGHHSIVFERSKMCVSIDCSWVHADKQHKSNQGQQGESRLDRGTQVQSCAAVTTLCSSGNSSSSSFARVRTGALKPRALGFLTSNGPGVPFGTASRRAKD